MKKLETLIAALNIDMSDKDAVISLQYEMITEMRAQLDSYHEINEKLIKLAMDQKVAIEKAKHKSLSLESQLVLANPVTEVFSLN